MKTKKSLLLTLLTGTMLLSSCSISKKTIGLFMYDAADTFLASLSNAIVDRLDNDYLIKVYDSESSQLIQNRQIVDAIDNNEINTLIINMVDRLSSGTIVQKAKQKQIPIIFYNREPVKSDIQGYNNIYYVGSSPVQEGTNQANMAMNLMVDPHHISNIIDKNGDNVLQCVFIRGEQSHQDTELRTYSCINTLIENGYELEILDMQYGDWSRNKGYDIMQKYYSLYGDKIEFVFSNNDDMALGAVDYLLEEKVFTSGLKAVEQPFPIVGVDGTTVGINAIKDGLLYGTTVNDTEKQADAIHELIKLINKEITIKDFSYTLTDNYYVYISGKIITGPSVVE